MLGTASRFRYLLGNGYGRRSWVTTAGWIRGHGRSVWMPLRRNSGIGLVIALYAGLTLVLLPRLSLWLDELIDLLGTQNSTFRSIIEYASTNPGGAPIWYLTQGLATSALGFSAFSARLPACIASVLSCCGLALLARRFGVKSPALCVAVFALFPLQLRYALEGRPYSEALCLSIWATVAFLRLIERPTVVNGLWYCVPIVLGLYTQPFSGFVAAAHAMWALGNNRLPAKSRLLTLGAVLVAAAGFVPWLAYASRNWTGGLPQGTAGILHPRVLLMVLRECLGGGYLLSGVVILLVLPGLRSETMARSTKVLPLLMVLVPIGFALLADSLSGYFVAIRQVIFILPSVALLVCFGVDYIARRARARIAVVVIAVVLAASVAYDVRWFRRPREDWKRAADVLSDSVRGGACALLAPERTAQILLFFHPSLIHHIYSEGSDFSTCQRVAVVMSHYSPDWNAIVRRLTELGFLRSQVIFSGKPTVTMLSR
jgi:uncharacterized membrane protein